MNVENRKKGILENKFHIVVVPYKIRFFFKLINWIQILEKHHERTFCKK